MSDFSMRIDIPDKDKHIVNSSVAVVHSDSTIIVDSPMSSAAPEFNSHKERLSNLLYRCIHYTSKYMGIDEITGMVHSEDNLYLYRLRGTNAITDHHCGGNIQYHPSSKDMLLWLEIMLWNRYNIIPSHNLLNETIKIKRKSGDIEDANIRNSPIRLSSTKNKYIIRVFLGNGDLVKHITLEDVYNLNPELDLFITIPNIDNLGFPDWIIEEYTQWISNIKTQLLWNNKSPTITIVPI